MRFGSLLGFIAGILAATASAETTVQLNAYSLTNPYNEDAYGLLHWEFGANTIVHLDRGIRLVPDRQSRQGYLWSKLPLNTPNWVVEFEFRVHGSGTRLFGDGFAFWFVTDRNVRGPIYGSKDRFNGLAVVFDTYANGRQTHSHPYVSVAIGDGQTPYDYDNDGKKNELGGCEADFRGRSHPTKARIKYTGKTLEVLLNIKDQNRWETCAVINDPKGIPKEGFIGFTAATGDVTDNHDIVYVSTHAITSLSGSGTIPEYKAPVNYSNNKGGDEGLSALFIVLLILIVIGVGVAGYFGYRSASKNNKRF